MKTKEYNTGDFEMEFEKAETITALQELLKRMKMQRVKWMAMGSHHSKECPIELLDEQMGIVEWELKKLKDAQSRGRFRAYYAFMKMLDEHYPYKTPVLAYRYILEDGVTNFKNEILSNMLHLAADERKPYLVRIQFAMEKLLKNVYASEDVLREWYDKYHTSEAEVFAPVASKSQNRIYDVLKCSANTQVPAIAGDDEMDDDEYEIQNDFYNVFYGRAVASVIELVRQQIEQYNVKQEAKADDLSVKSSKGVALTSFEDLFYDSALAGPCIELLREDEYPLIGERNNYTGNLKSGFCVWIAELNRQSVIKHQPDEVYAALLRSKFSELATFNKSLFSKTNNKAEKLYREVFRNKIERIRQNLSATKSPTR